MERATSSMETGWMRTAWPFLGLAGLLAAAAVRWLSLPVGVKALLDALGWGALVFGAFVALSEGKRTGSLLAYTVAGMCLVGIPLRANWYPYNAGPTTLLMLGGLVVAMAYFMAASPPSLWGLWFAVAALLAFLTGFVELATPRVHPLALGEHVIVWFPVTAGVCAGLYLSLRVWRRSGNRLGLVFAGLCAPPALLGVWGVLAMLRQGLKSLRGLTRVF